jgi:hypothetical protein
VSHAVKNGKKPVLSVVAVGTDLDRKLNLAQGLA